MKAKNLKAKPYIIPAKSGNVLLAPAGKAVEIPSDADKDYLQKLAGNGLVEIIEDEPVKKTRTQKVQADEE